MIQAIDQLIETLKQAAKQKIIVVSHRDPDGDALGSIVAMTLVLRQLGFNADALNRDAVPTRYQYLDPEGLIYNLDGLPHRNYTLALVLDSSDLFRLGFSLKKEFPHLNRVCNIDHHQSNAYFGDINIVDAQASANCEILYKIITKLEADITPIIANALYTGITTDTGSFKYESTSPETMHIAGHLMEAGADINLIRYNLWENEPYQRIQALSNVLNNLQVTEDGQLAWIKISQDEIRKFNLTNDDLESFVDYPRTIAGVEVALFLKETEENFVKVSVRTKSVIDATFLAGLFDGGGHKRAAGFRVQGRLNEIEGQVIERFKIAMGVE